MMNKLDISHMLEYFPNTPTMPMLFVGHGSPLVTLEENQFNTAWQTIGQNLPRPTAILCISAHWETAGVAITAMDRPKTIYDFRGFPPELYALQYPALGSPVLANMVKTTLDPDLAPNISQLDHQWGLDHGTWCVFKHIYPQADIPIVQLSLDQTQSPQQHYELAQHLYGLRNKGVLIVGSGNIVHNLGRVDLRRIEESYGFDWALATQERVNRYLINRDHLSLISYQKQGVEFNLSIPTPEHFLPLLYILGLQRDNDEIDFFNDTLVGGSISMTSIQVTPQ